MFRESADDETEVPLGNFYQKVGLETVLDPYNVVLLSTEFLE